MLSSDRLLNVYVILLSVATSVADPYKQIGPVDYCESETFEASCSGNDVILITSALYGRMALGRCVSKNYGHVGCKVDARHVLDGLCSGKKSCHIRANHHFLLAVKSRACPNDVSAYLSVSYKCVSVLRSREKPCIDHPPTLLQSGYISPRGTPKGTGSSPCPLTIQPPGGKHLNFTLFKFSSPEDPSVDSNSRCFEVLEITEGERSEKVISCTRDPRQRAVYVSEGAAVHISFEGTSVLDHLGTFLLSFQVTCPDPVLPSNSHFKRHSETEGRVVCDVTEDARTLSCEDGKWQELDVASLCKSDNSWMSSGSGKDEEKGGIMIVAIGAIVGMVVGGILLWMAISLYKKCVRCIRGIKHPTKPTVMIEIPEMTYANHLKPITETEDLEAGQPFTEVHIERHNSQRKHGGATLTRLPSKARNGTLQRVAVEYRMPARREVRASYHGGNGNDSPGNGTLPRGPGTKYQSKTLSRVPRSPLSNGHGTVPRSPKVSREEASPRSSPKGPVTVHNFNYGTPPRGVKPGGSPAGISREHYAKINRPLPPTPDSEHDYETPVQNPNIALEESMSIGSRSTLNSSTYAYNDSSTYANRSTDDNRSIGERSAIGTPTRSTLRSTSSEEAKCTCGHGAVNGDSSISPDTTDNSGGTEDDRPLYANHTIPGEDKKNANDVPDAMTRSIIEDERPVYANHTMPDNKESKENKDTQGNIQGNIQGNTRGNTPVKTPVKIQENTQNTKGNTPVKTKENTKGSPKLSEVKSQVIEDERPVYANHMVQNEQDLPKNLTDLLKDKVQAVILDERPVYANHTMPNIKSSVETSGPEETDDRPVYANHTMPTGKTISERIQNKNNLNEKDLKEREKELREQEEKEKEMREKEEKEKEIQKEKEKEMLKERRVSTFKDY